MLIPIIDVLSLVPVSRATLYRVMERTDFPKQIGRASCRERVSDTV